jgi:hypothetical protein
MPFHITCVCGHVTVVPEEGAGQTVRCRVCDRQLAVPPTAVPLPPPAPQVPPPSPPEPSVRVEVVPAAAQRPRRRSRQDTARLLALALLAPALVSGVPIALAAAGANAESGGWQLERWAVAVLGVGLLQVVYAIYLAQVPDWSSVWVVFLATLGTAAAYAAVMGLRLLASPGNPVLIALELEATRFSAGQQAGWCLIMMLLNVAVSYAAGRLGAAWRREST